MADALQAQTAWLARSQLLLGGENLARLGQKTVAIFGLGGVGSYTAEALARTGVGGLILVDHDSVCESNLNRQLIANRSNLGQAKVKACRDRLLSINPNLRLLLIEDFFQDNLSLFFAQHGLGAGSRPDYIVDAIDSVHAKLNLICDAQAGGIPLISAMGAGNKLDPTAFKVCDIFETSHDRLARVIRQALRKRGVKGQKVVFSQEKSRTLFIDQEEKPDRLIGSLAFVTGVAGLICAGEVIKDLCQLTED